MIISLLDVNEIVTYQVNIDFDPNSAVVREGMTTTLEYVIQEAKNVLIVPTGAIVEEGGKHSLFLIDRNISVSVETGISDGKMTEIWSGVKLGEKIRGE